MLGAEERERVRETSAVDRVAVGVGELRRHPLHHLLRPRHRPAGAVEVGRRERSLVFRLQPGTRFLRSIVKNRPRLRVGIKGLALLDADCPKRIDHRLVARQPGLALHHSVERLEEAGVVWDVRLEHYAGCIDEHRLRRVASLRQRVELHALRVRDGLRHGRVAAGLKDRAQQRVALEVVRRQHDVTIGNLLLVAGREDETLAALALVHAGRADVL